MAGVTHLRVHPIELRTANEFVETLHRHHKPVQGHRFSLGVSLGETLVGVMTCGRPVAAGVPPLEVLEVTRLCTDGTRNACSILYAAAARAARAMGYRRIQTYVLDTEPAITLRAAGWTFDGMSKTRGHWHGRDKLQPEHLRRPKQRWIKELS